MATKKLQILDSLIKQAENANTLDGKHASDFVSTSGWTSNTYLGTDENGQVVEKNLSFITGLTAVVSGETLTVISETADVNGETLNL